MSSAEVLELAQWPTRHSHYKLDVFTQGVQQQITRDSTEQNNKTKN